MRLISTARTVTGDRVRLTGALERERTGERFETYLEYEVPGPGFVDETADPFAAAMMLAAMRGRERVEIEVPISPRLAVTLPRIRDVFHAWWPRFERVEIRAPAGPPRAAQAARAATFFSGGVDSFYSLLKNLRGAGTLPVPLTHVIYFRGIEIQLERSRDLDTSEAWVREVAAGAGVGCVVGASNLRSTIQGPRRGLHWERHYFGTGLASVALGVGAGFSHVCIPSGFSYHHITAHGSTPLVDEMYSTERLQIVHDGAEMARPNKLARILEWDEALVLGHLRVCILNAGGGFNCGQCYKCVRTALVLYLLGVWDRASTFPDKATGHWERVVRRDHLPLLEENLAFARVHGRGTPVLPMLERIVRARRRNDAAREFLSASTPASLLAMLGRVRGRGKQSRGRGAASDPTKSV